MHKHQTIIFAEMNMKTCRKQMILMGLVIAEEILYTNTIEFVCLRISW